MSIPFKNYFTLEYPKKVNTYQVYLLIGFLIGLFLIVFQPYGLHNFTSPYKKVFLFGYGILVTLLLSFNLICFNRIFRHRWTIMSQILLTLSATVLISIGLYFYSLSINIYHNLSFADFFLFFKQSLIIAIFPIIATINWGRKAVKYEKLPPNDLTAEVKTNASIQLFSLDQKKSIKMELDTLLFIESIGNYVHFTFLEGDTTKKIKLRSTLKHISNQLSAYPFITKVHRAYMVNTKYLKSLKGNSQKSFLILRAVKKEIPVSRSLIKTLQSKYEN